jgi:hypothetical protein
MQSTLTKQADPHDVFLIESVLAACAKLASVEPDRTVSPPLAPHVQMASAIAAGAPVPTVDTTFRATAVDPVEIPGDQLQNSLQQDPLQHGSLQRSSAGRWLTRTSVGFVFALVSAVAAAAWQHYGDAATQTIARWAPPFTLAPSSPATPVAADQDAAPVNQASTTTEAPVQPAAQPAQDIAPAAIAAVPEPAALPPAVARDLAAMGQQIEELKASIEQLKAGQEQLTKQMSRDVAARTPEPKASEQPARPKLAAIPPRPTAAPVRRPRPAYPPVPIAAAPPTPIAPPPPAMAAMPPQPITQPDGEPVVRPPMPLR